jgi:transposase-like protein
MKSVDGRVRQNKKSGDRLMRNGPTRPGLNKKIFGFFRPWSKLHRPQAPGDEMSYVRDRQGESIMTCSMDYRRAVAAAYDECGSSAEVAGQFGCSESWVRRLIQRRRETGSLEPFKHTLPGKRDVGRLFDAIGDASNRVTHAEAENYIRHCGYAAGSRCKTLQRGQRFSFRRFIAGQRDHNERGNDQARQAKSGDCRSAAAERAIEPESGRQPDRQSVAFQPA